MGGVLGEVPLPERYVAEQDVEGKRHYIYIFTKAQQARGRKRVCVLRCVVADKPRSRMQR